jgi:hypothetical protein
LHRAEDGLLALEYDDHLYRVPPRLGQLGTANPDALTSTVLRHHSVHADFETVSQLSSTLAAVKTEHDDLA